MLFNAGIQPLGRYVLVTASGDAELPELCALADLPSAVAARRGSKRALFDLLALHAVLAAGEDAQLGTHIARTLAGFDRVAVVLASEADSKPAHLAAEAGLAIQTFSTLMEANDWLLDES